MKQQSLRQKFDYDLKELYYKFKKLVKKECEKQGYKFDEKLFRCFVNSSIFTIKKLENKFGYVGIIYNYNDKNFYSEVTILHDEDKGYANDKIALEIILSRFTKRFAYKFSYIEIKYYSKYFYINNNNDFTINL